MTASSRASGSNSFGLRSLLMISAHAVAWCALWQDVSIPNLLAGAILAVVLMMLGFGTPRHGSVRPVELIKLLWLVFVDLMKSTVTVAKEIVTPNDQTDEAIVALQLPAEARHPLLLLVVAITLTPGTAVVDADPDTGTLYLHLLHHHNRESVTSHVHELAQLACRALPIS